MLFFERPSHVATFLPHLGQYIVFGSAIATSFLHEKSTVRYSDAFLGDFVKEKLLLFIIYKKMPMALFNFVISSAISSAGICIIFQSKPNAN